MTENIDITKKEHRISEIKEILENLDVDNKLYYEDKQWTIKLTLIMLVDKINRYINTIKLIEDIVDKDGHKDSEKCLAEYTTLYHQLVKLDMKKYLIDRFTEQNFPIEGLTRSMPDNTFVIDTSKISDEDFQFVNPFKDRQPISKELDDLVNPLKIKFIKDISQVHIIEEIDLNKKVSEIPTEEIKFATTNEEY